MSSLSDLKLRHRDLFFGGLVLAVLLLGVEAQADNSPRVRMNFDAGWKFSLAKTAALGNPIPINQWQYESDPNGRDDQKQRTIASLDSTGAGWQTVQTGTDVFHGATGFDWFQTTLPVYSGANKVIRFEQVDDNGTVYLNGHRLIHHEGWNQEFDVPLDKYWNAAGPNILTVLVENTGGGGGITAPAMLAVLPPHVDLPEEAHPGFVDAAWRTVHLPHDYVIEGAFSQNADAGHGALPVGPAWYRKTFDIPAAWKGSSLWIDFDGIYRDSIVWFNGRRLGEHQSGYIGCRYDLASYANYGGRNVIAVSVDATRPEGWWYEGGGIYRHVWLTVANPVHIEPDGVYVTSHVSGVDPTGKTPESGKSPSAVVTAQITVNNPGLQRTVEALVQVYGPNGQMVGSTRSAEVLGQAPTVIGESAHNTTTFDLTVPVPAAALWSVAHPNMYLLRTVISEGGAALDSLDTPFGIRTIYFDADRGFFLNGKPFKIQGVCIHQDFAGVGVALPDSLDVWRVKKLKEFGVNGWRMSHNPPMPELLDACDRLGLVVMDENRHLGDTYSSKTSPGTPYSDLTDLADLVKRDRNHPSIIMWSMCNEEWSLSGSPEGAAIFSAMKTVVKKYDTTRPITCAENSGFGAGITTVEDLEGINYNNSIYDSFHQQFPNLPMFISEEASVVATRGEYVQDDAKGYVSSYFDKAVFSPQSAEEDWGDIAKRPFLAGGFVWTGFDYKGEPTPYGWPCVNSHFGILDEAGFPKDLYYFYKSVWTNQPIVHIMPYWVWPGHEGQSVPVWVFSNADHVELFLNGKSLGVQPMPQYGHLVWNVPYAAGSLVARGYRNGQLIASDEEDTTGPPAAIRLKVDTDSSVLKADEEDTVVVDASVVDAQGRVVPTADNEISFAVTGAGHANGVGNGDPSSHEPDRGTQRKAFHGLAVVLVQAGNKPGAIKVTASADGLKTAVLDLSAR